MANIINYAQTFASQIEQQYTLGLTSADFAENKKFKFINAQTIQIPNIELSGYKDHSRDGNVNRGVVKNTYTPLALTHDRDISFFVDDMDVDETAMATSAANVTATFNAEQAIPETDAFRYSKLFTELTAKLAANVSTTALTKANILTVIDAAMEAMSENRVPKMGRRMKVTPAVNTLLKQAQEYARYAVINGTKDLELTRVISVLDGVRIDEVPSDLMKTAYNFADGFEAGETAGQINFILYHNSAIIAPVKVSDIYLWPKGATPDSAFGYLYQNRSYQDLFIIKEKAAGVFINQTPKA